MKNKHGLIALALLTGCASPSRAPAAMAASSSPATPEATELVAPAPPQSAQPLVHAIDRSTLTDVGMGAALDYGDPAMWACRPGNQPNECERNIDATEIRADGTRTVVAHERAADPGFDCFYVYPTVKLSGTGNLTDFSDAGVALVNDPLQSQASRFSKLCTLYAPLYRQAGLDRTTGQLRPAPGSDRALAVTDVRAAFKHYLEHLNQGRKFVLLGHSQGTGMLTAMMQLDVDPVPEVRERMISALLIGGGVHVAKGERQGGSFQHIPTCSEPGETGCVIAYASYSAEVPPPKDSRFAAAPAEGMEMACTEPAALAGNPGPYQGSYVRAAVTNSTFRSDQAMPEGIETPYALYRGAVKGQCVKRDGLHYLEISLADPANVPPYRSKALEASVGLHVVDYNLALDDLIAAVALQAETALR